MLLLASLLAGCLRDTPERAAITQVRVARTLDGATLDVTQELLFSPTVRDALRTGIPLRLVYQVTGCDADEAIVLRLRYAPLGRQYELQREGDAAVRRFPRIDALFAALDRVRLPLRRVPRDGCSGRVAVALDLTSLPTPLRFPAFLDPEAWRMVSPPVVWPTPSSRP